MTQIVREPGEEVPNCCEFCDTGEATEVLGEKEKRYACRPCAVKRVIEEYRIETGEEISAEHADVILERRTEAAYQKEASGGNEVVIYDSNGDEI